MVTGNAGALRSILSRVGVPQPATGLTDRELLGRFVAHRDEAAFETVFRRHAPMVLGVCRRSLGDLHEAEDAFQATFIVLARKAASVRWQASVGSWLYEVAHRVAMEAKARSRRLRERECVVSPRQSRDLLSEITGREFVAVLDEELLRLPEKYRAPIVLCCLEGHWGDEAARGLGCSLSTLRRRLSRGRELLRVRLARRGVLLSAAALSSALLAHGAASAAVPCAPSSALRAVYRSAAGQAAPVTPASAAALAEQVARGMLNSKLRSVAALFLALAVLSAGAGLVAHLASARPPALTGADPPRAAAPVGEPLKPADKSQARTDLLGDPLPPGAVARLGTSRLRGNRVLFFPDGKRVLRERAGGDLQIFEVPSGKPLAVIHAADVPGRTGIVGYTAAFTRDGKYLAAVCWLGRCGIWETATGRLVRWLDSGGFFSILHCEFSPDDKLLAVGRAGPRQMDDTSVSVYEVETGRMLFTTPGSNGVFAPDGRSLVTWNGYMIANPEGAARVAIPGGEVLVKFPRRAGSSDLYAPTDGAWFYEFSMARQVIAVNVTDGIAKYAFGGPLGGQDNIVYCRHAAGRRELIAVGTKPPEVWCWDLESGKQLWQERLAAAAYYPVLSADGSALVTPEKSGNIRVWDAATGKERVSFRPASIGHGTDVAVSPDGKTVSTTSGGIFSSAVAFWDASSGKMLSDLPGHSARISAAAFALDGATVYTTGKDQTLRVWDAASGRERSHAKADAAAALAAAPDGAAVFVAQEDGSVRVLEAGTGRFLRDYRLFQRSLTGMGVIDAGARLVAAGRDGAAADSAVLRIFDARTGTKIREFGGSEGAAEQLATSAGAGLVATSHAGKSVVLWDRDGHKLSQQFGQGKRVSAWAKGETPYRIGSLGLSPDGRWLAYSDQEAGVAIVDTRTGHEVSRARTGASFQTPAARDELRDALAFSPDGKVVAWSGVESTAEIFLIEARTGRVRRRLRGDSRPVQHLAFSPDGSRLLSAGPDGSALVWDVSGRPVVLNAAAPSAERVADWWELLAEENAAKTYDVMGEMAGNPSAAVALLRERLRPTKSVAASKLDALLERLDGERFADREAASRELVALGEVAEPRLREAARSSPSLEVKRRAADCLEQLGPAKLRPERAVEVLEMIGDRPASQLLAEWASGMRGAALTDDAAGALSRLDRKRVDGAGRRK